MSNNIKRKIFISYHHARDQTYVDNFINIYSQNFEIFTDRSLGEPIRSNDTEYINRKIREEYIVGSSCTIVFCGAETYKRKYVDWEIYSTLHHQKGLLGIGLPISQLNPILPTRLRENIQSTYALWGGTWTGDLQLSNLIENAISRSAIKFLIKNSLPKMSRNLS